MITRPAEGSKTAVNFRANIRHWIAVAAMLALCIVLAIALA
jgi:hypothetical protein